MSNQASSPSSTERLAGLVDQKHACLVQLREIGMRQEELIRAGDMTQLLRVLTSKHHLISTLQRIEDELTPFREDDPDARVWRSPQSRAECAQMVAACRELLDEVVRQEKLNESLMLKRREAVADRLGQVHAAARASGAYRMHTRGRIKTAAGTSREASAMPATSGGNATSGLDLSSDIR
jgi:flagellar biosynthesis/type III secretory pathway chaperone